MSHEIAFLYALNNNEYRLPWTKPDLIRLKAWYRRLNNHFGLDPNYSIWLIGGIWSNQSSQTWDVDLFITPADGKLKLEDANYLGQLYDVMFRGYDFALNEFRFLIDFNYCLEKRVLEIHRLIQAFERHTSGKLVSPEEHAYSIFCHYKKVHNDVVKFEYKKPHTKTIPIGENRWFYERPNRLIMTKQMEQIKNGRIFYPPIKLQDLFS